MAKDSRVPDKPSVDLALQKAFKAIEAQPVPEKLTRHLQTLAGPKRRPDGRS